MDAVMKASRFSIRVDRWCRLLFVPLGIGPRRDHVEVTHDVVTARLGWTFVARLDRAAIVGVAPHRDVYGAWGAHGWRGRWLVNGSSRGIVRIDLEPRQRARLLGVWPLKLRQLLVSLDDPDGFLAMFPPDVR
jgi:hypothetical protein